MTAFVVMVGKELRQPLFNMVTPLSPNCTVPAQIYLVNPLPTNDTPMHQGLFVTVVSDLFSKLESDWSVYDSFSDLFRVRGRAKVRLGLGTY